jgi:predicted O-methyltransferase YrrM
MSTLWLCSRVGRVRSLEWDRAWLDRLDSEIRREQRDNVDLRLCTGRAETEFADIADHSVDFVFIDGGPRPYCLAKLWPKLRPGGSAYLDNWDSDVFWMEDLNARLFLDDRAGEIARRTLFVDYVPTQVAVSEGLLLDKGD